jgi:alpha-tubulin suppressor-like RCC1 family protein
MTKRLLPLLVLISLIATTSCIDEALAPADEAVGNLEIVSGNNQSGRLSGQLTDAVVVKVTTKSGQPVTGATVEFKPDTGSGTVSASSALSDAEGLARVNWTLGNSFGTKTLVATAGGDRKVTFTATTVPDRLELAGGNNQIGRASAELSGPVVVKVLDLAGRPAAGVAVTFAPETGSGTVVPSLVATESDGTARAVWTLGSAPGPKVLRVTAATATAPVTVNATATQDVLTVVSGGNQAIVAGATLTAPVVVQMKDQTGAIVSGAQLTFTPTAGSGTVSPASVFTDAQGRAQTTWTLGSTPGTKALQVTGGSAIALTVNASALSTDSLQVVSGNAQAGRAGAVLPSPVVVRVLDTNGRTVQGATVTFAPVAVTDGTVSATTVLTDIEGKAQTNWTLGTGTGAKSLRASAGSATPITFTATATADRLELVSGGSQVARPSTALSAPVVVRLVGLNGQNLAGVTVTFAASGGGSPLPASVVTDADGTARTSWTLGAALGLQQLTVTAGTAGALTVSATAAQDRITLVSGGGQSARINTALADSIVVKVVDPSGAAVPNVEVTFTTAAPLPSPNTAKTDAQGLAKTRWTMDGTAGVDTLTATATGVDGLKVVARALKADSVFLSAGGSQTGLVGAALPQEVVVEVRDRLSQVVIPGIAVTFTPNVAGTANDGTVSAATVITDAAGLARTRWTLGTTKGTKTLNVATVDAGALTLTATALQDTSRSITPFEGGQTAAVSETLANSLRVRVVDRFGNAVVGDTIVWNDRVTNGATVTPLRSITDANGDASTSVRLGVAVDSTLIRARISNRQDTVTFLATGTVAYTEARVGNFFSCAVTGEGRSYCWGFNGNGQLSKQPGSTTPTTRPSTPITATDSLAGPFVNFRDLSLGRTHGCAISINRQLLCWGSGNGNFGTGALAAVTSVNTASTTAAVTTGEAHTCVLDIDGRIRCSGENQQGQLGDGTSTSQIGNVFTTVTTARFSSVSAGRSFTCAFRRYDGTNATRVPQCWGDNILGQLGIGTTVNGLSPATVSDPLAQVAFDSTSLVTGLAHACVLNTTGNAFCWGSNGSGQLGSSAVAAGPGQRATAMVAVDMPVGKTFVRLAAGDNHTCGLTSTGEAFCWGLNSRGQLGNDDPLRENKSIPTAVSGGLFFKSLSLGELHSCGVQGVPGTSGTTAVTGRVFCWGDNEYGQLGDEITAGRTTPILTPKRVVNQP